MSALPNPSLAVRSLSWPGLELRHLTAFHAVVDEGSFGRAARRLGYTQSAVSQQVAALERAVGRRLLTRARGGGRPALTTAGKIVLAHADAIARELAIARDALERLDTQTKQASLRIVMRYATGLGLTPLFLEGMHGATPHDIAISDGGSDCTMGDLVALGQADLALVEQPRLDLAFERLITEP